MKKLFVVLMVLTMLLSFSACGDSDVVSQDDVQITTSFISNDESNDTSSEKNEEDENSKEAKDEEVSSEKEEKSDDSKDVKAMYSSKKDLKVNGHYILYNDGTWSYQSDSVSLMVTAEDDIKDIEDRIESGDLFKITENDLNMVAAG